MKKFYQFLGCFVLSLLFMQNLFAGDFTPESNTKYCLQTKGADLVICPDAKLNATLQPFLKSNKDNYELTFEPVDGGGYHIRNTNNQYLYYSGYTMTFTQGYIASKESNGSKGFSLTSRKMKLMAGIGYVQ